jgi:hypothetical protein
LPKALVTTEQEICWATLLAPDIVEAILDGKQGPEVTLARVFGTFPDGVGPAAYGQLPPERIGAGRSLPQWCVSFTLSRERPRRYFC